jgi:ABC-type Fe3+-siderophore transport system permease subunit
MPLPSLDEWLSMTAADRARVLEQLNPYSGEGSELIGAITERFREEFQSVPGLQIHGPGVYHGGTWVIGTTRPLVFDRRRVPDSYLGIEVRSSISGPMPPEFESDDVWAPRNFERFVDRCGDEIRAQLGNPNLTRDEMLDAVTGVPFRQYQEVYARPKPSMTKNVFRAPLVIGAVVAGIFLLLAFVALLTSNPRWDDHLINAAGAFAVGAIATVVLTLGASAFRRRPVLAIITLALLAFAIYQIVMFFDNMSFL